MKIPENSEQLQLLVIRYLYGDMNDSETAEFDSELKANGNLQRALEEEQRLNSALPLGTQPFISEQRIQGNRWLLQQNLQKENRQQFSLQGWIQGLTERPLTVAFQGMAMAATFVLGIIIASPSELAPTTPGIEIAANAEANPLDLVNNDDYEIYQLKVNGYDATTGDIDLSFSLASETRVTGNVSDQQINRLMAVALQDDISSSSRLDTINALHPVSSGSDIYEALIYVLSTDQNPGVRYQAVRSLVELTHEDKVRDALRRALLEDVNPGVRVEAFEALASNPDQQTLEVFRQQMDTDSNEYIRAQARTIIEESDGAVIEI